MKMKKIIVVPLKQVNGIAFGTKRAEVRERLGGGGGGEYEEFYKEEGDKVTTDDFQFCHVYYDEKEDGMEAIEIFDDDVAVYIDQGEGQLVKVFPIPLEEAQAIIKDAVKDEDGLQSTSQSIGIYAPEGEMESILFG
eukprot:jgi/Orpsp1_1/1175172/evm.model.c7180000052868.1